MPNVLNEYGKISENNRIIVALCTHSSDKADNLDFAYYSLDKSLKPILLASAFEVLTGKLALVDENDESIAIDRFDLENSRLTPRFPGSLTAASGWSNGFSLYFLNGEDYKERDEKEAEIFFISPVFLDRPNGVFYYKPTLIINRKIELSFEELKKIKKAKVEISAPQ